MLPLAATQEDSEQKGLVPRRWHLTDTPQGVTLLPGCWGVAASRGRGVEGCLCT